MIDIFKAGLPLVVILSMLMGCSSSDHQVSFIRQAIETLPHIQLNSKAAPHKPVRTKNKRSCSSNIGDCAIASTIFRMQCHMLVDGDSENYCPPMIDVQSDQGNNPYQFTTDTLLGLIYFGEKYASNIYAKEGSYKTCGTLNASEKAVTAGSFKGSPWGNPTRYIIDIFTLFNCMGAPTSGGNVNYVAYSKSLDDGYYTLINTRQHVPISPNSSILATDIYEEYVSMDGDTPKFLAFNFAGIGNGLSRVVLLANFAKRKFAVKYSSGGSVNSWLVAVGSGGTNPGSDAPYGGNYRVRFRDGTSTVYDLCVDNEDGTVKIGATCEAKGIPWSTQPLWQSSSDIVGYLEMDSSDASRVIGFLSPFDSMTPLQTLGSLECPNAAGDADLYFPSSIE